MIVAGCGHKTDDVATKDVKYVYTGIEPASVPGKYGGQFVYGSISNPKTFNYWIASETSSTDVLGPLYDALNDRNAFTLKQEPRLAALPTVSKNGLVYTYHLRPGLKWSDGVSLNADDVIFTLDMLYSPTTQSSMTESLLVDVDQPDGTVKRMPFKYRKINETTVEFTLPVPYAAAQDIFSFPIAPKHMLNSAFIAGKFNTAYNVNTDPSQLVSSGPWIMTHYAPGERVEYKPNPHYWKTSKSGQKLPYFDTYIYTIVPDINSLVLKFNNKDTDAVSFPATYYPDLKRGETSGNYTIYDTGPDWGFQYLSFNMNPNANIDKRLVKLFQDVRFRKAVSFAINRKRISDDVYNGLAVPAFGPLTSANSEFYNPNIPKTPYDLNQAKLMLASMGISQMDSNKMLLYNGKEIKFTILTNVENDQRKSICAIIAENLREIGINATFTPIVFNKLVSDLDDAPYNWEACLLGFTGGVDPHDDANVWRSSAINHQWWPKEKQPATPWEAEIDKIFIDADHEMDPIKRKALYDRWQVIAANELPFIYTVTPTLHAAVRNKFGNLKPCSLDRDAVLWNLDEEFDNAATRLTP